MLYVSISGGRGSASTGGGWRRTCAWRERRWPSFIIWRWGGPDPAGWTRCPWRAHALLLPPRRRPTAALTSPPRASLQGPGRAGRLPRGRARRQRERQEDRPNARLERVPARAAVRPERPDGPPNVRPDGPPNVPLGRAPERVAGQPGRLAGLPSARLARAPERPASPRGDRSPGSHRTILSRSRASSHSSSGRGPRRS
jgi:hypothetical protein